MPTQPTLARLNPFQLRLALLCAAALTACSPTPAPPVVVPPKEVTLSLRQAAGGTVTLQGSQALGTAFLLEYSAENATPSSGDVSVQVVGPPGWNGGQPLAVLLSARSTVRLSLAQTVAPVSGTYTIRSGSSQVQFTVNAGVRLEPPSQAGIVGASRTHVQVGWSVLPQYKSEIACLGLDKTSLCASRALNWFAPATDFYTFPFRGVAQTTQRALSVLAFDQIIVDQNTESFVQGAQFPGAFNAAAWFGPQTTRLPAQDPGFSAAPLEIESGQNYAPLKTFHFPTYDLLMYGSDATDFRFVRSLTVVKLLLDGSRDMSYGVNGKLVYAIATGGVDLQRAEALEDSAVDAQGNLYWALRASSPFTQEQVLKVLKWTPAGKQALDFGQGGELRVFEKAQPERHFISLGLRADGGVMAFLSNHSVHTFDARGQRYAHLGTQGVVNLEEFFGFSPVRDAHFNPDGSLLTAEVVYTPEALAALKIRRFNASYTPESSFGTEGTVVLPPYKSSQPCYEGEYNVFNRVTPQALYLNGLCALTGNVALFKLNSQGQLETPFGDEGALRYPDVSPFQSTTLLEPAPTVLDNGGVVLMGRVYNGGEYAACRVLVYTPSGQPDLGFGWKGVSGVLDEYKTNSAHMNACLKGVDALGRLTVVEKDGYDKQFKVLKIKF